MKSTISPLILLAVTQLLAACGPATDEDGLLLEPEAVESQTQALSESCTSSAVSLVQPDGAAVTFQYPRCSYADSAATSVDGTYDQPLCPSVWHPASCGELFCFPASCQLRFSFPVASGGFSKVRVAGFTAAYGVFKGRVRTGVYSDPGPC